MKALFYAGAFALLLSGTALAQGVQPSLPVNPDRLPPPPPDPTPDVVESYGSWDIGELDSLGKYASTLTIDNLCQTTETVTVQTKNLPEVTFNLVGCQLQYADKSCQATVPPGSLDVAVTIEPEDWIYYVDPMAPFAHPQPFKRMAGEVVITHPKNDNCLEAVETYAVAYIVKAVRADLPPPKRGPEKIAGAGFCEVWWNTGQRPPLLKPDVDCTGIIRPLASGYRERILAPYVAQDPAAWAWLPTVEQIGSMSSEEMVAIKIRASAQIAP